LTYLTSSLAPVGPLPGLAVPADEGARLRVLDAYEPDALQDDPELEAIARFAAKLCEAPIALVSLVERERQRFLARQGIADTGSPRDTSFCAHAMAIDGVMEVPDATLDARFADNPLVTGAPHIRFYAGQPLVSEDGAPLGSLCVIDTAPRPGGLTELQREGMKVLGRSVMRRLQGQRQALVAERELLARESHLRSLADSIPAIAWSADADGNFEYFNKRMVDFTGRPDDKTGQAFHPEDWKKASAAWQHSLRTGETYEVEHRLCRHDGQYRWMMSRAVPVRDDNGRIVRWFGTAVDIHDLYEMAESRELMAKELSHRIKNIFAVVSGLISLSIRKRPDLKDFGDDLTGTIRALGRAHDYVRPAEGERSGTLHGVLEDLFSTATTPRSPPARRPRWRWCSTSWRPIRPSTARFRPGTARSTSRSPIRATRCCFIGPSAAARRRTTIRPRASARGWSR
jgi:PAS domain S-box-containing protein